METELDKFNDKFKVDKLKIYETDYWIWSLRPLQATLGAGVLSLKRECGTFSELDQDEFCDLNNIIKVVEKTLSEAFKYDIINYLMLMMNDKQVHYHIIPRYEKNIEFSETVWNDSGWPGMPKLDVNSLDINELIKIQIEIKNNLIK